MRCAFGAIGLACMAVVVFVPSFADFALFIVGCALCVTASWGADKANVTREDIHQMRAQGRASLQPTDRPPPDAGGGGTEAP